MTYNLSQLHTNTEKKERKKMDKTIIKKVNDLGASAYILMHGYKVSGKDADGRTILFEIPVAEEREFEQLTMDYLTSEYHRFDSCLMSLKKLGNYNSSR